MIATLYLATTNLLSNGQLLAAAGDEAAGPSDLQLLIRHLIAAIIFAAVGIVVLALSFWLMERLTPFSIVKEIEEDQNVALGIVVGAITIGMSIIIGAAILG